MSSVLFLVDDKSPLIHYDSTWGAGNSQDNLADQSVIHTILPCVLNNNYSQIFPRNVPDVERNGECCHILLQWHGLLDIWC
jgi:hypothetical protein